MSPGHRAQCVSPAEADVSPQGRHHRWQAARIYPGIHERDIPGQTVSSVGSECPQKRWCCIVIAFFVLVLFLPINNKFQQWILFGFRVWVESFQFLAPSWAQSKSHNVRVSVAQICLKALNIHLSLIALSQVRPGSLEGSSLRRSLKYFVLFTLKAW